MYIRVIKFKIMKNNYKSISVLIYLILITQIVISQGIAAEMFFIHSLKEGERLKSLSNYYQIKLEHIINANISFKNLKEQEGLEVKIPMDEIESIDIIYIYPTTKDSQSINLYTATFNSVNLFQSFWINDAETRNILEKSHKSRIDFIVEIKCSNKQKKKIGNKTDIINLVANLQRIESSRRDTQYDLTKLQAYSK